MAIKLWSIVSHFNYVSSHLLIMCIQYHTYITEDCYQEVLTGKIRSFTSNCIEFRFCLRFNAPLPSHPLISGCEFENWGKQYALNYHMGKYYRMVLIKKCIQWLLASCVKNSSNMRASEKLLVLPEQTETGEFIIIFSSIAIIVFYHIKDKHQQLEKHLESAEICQAENLAPNCVLHL